MDNIPPKWCGKGRRGLNPLEPSSSGNSSDANCAITARLHRWVDSLPGYFIVDKGQEGSKDILLRLLND